MKLKRAALLLLTVAFAAMSMLTAFAGSTESDYGDEITVTYEDGVLTVVADGSFGMQDWIGVYKAGESVNPNAGGVASIFWWYVGPAGGEIVYPDDAGGSTVMYNRYDELDGGAANDPLKPGTYWVMIMVNDGYDTLDGTEPIEFVVPDPNAATEVPTTEDPAATDEPAVTDEPTANPTQEPTEEPTAEPTAEPTEAPTDAPAATEAPADATDAPADATAETGDDSDTDNDSDSKKPNVGLIVGICIAAAAVIAAVIGFVVAKKKK